MGNETETEQGPQPAYLTQAIATVGRQFPKGTDWQEEPCQTAPSKPSGSHVSDAKRWQQQQNQRRANKVTIVQQDERTWPVACWYCQDAHFVLNPDDPIGARRPIECPVCNWVNEHRMQIVSLANDWTKGMDLYTFAEYDKTEPEVADGYDAAVAFADAVILAWGKRRSAVVTMPHDAPWALTLFGTFGTGKTHLGAAIANAVRPSGVQSLYCDAKNLWPYLGCIQNPSKDESYEGRLMAVMQVPLLILDEAGGSVRQDGDASGVSEASWDRRRRLIAFRYSRRLPTVFLDQRHPRFWNDPASADRIVQDGNEIVPHGEVSYRNKQQREADALAAQTQGG